MMIILRFFLRVVLSITAAGLNDPRVYALPTIDCSVERPSLSYP